MTSMMGSGDHEGVHVVITMRWCPSGVSTPTHVTPPGPVGSRSKVK